MVLLASPASSLAQTKKKTPNVLFILTDDHASAAIGCYKSWLGKYARTPNIDGLAREGMRFTSSLVTNSICTPSRAAILTGQYSHKNGVYTVGDRIDPARVHIGHLLQRLGFQTALVGKWHLITDPAGFDYWDILPGLGSYHNPKLRRRQDKGYREFKGGYSEDVITDLSLDWLRKRDKNRPFFLCCHYKAPHREWNPAPRNAGMFKNDTIPEPATLLDDYKGRSKAIGSVKMRVGEDFLERDLETKIPTDLPRDELRKWAYQRYMKRYLACAFGMDENVGRLLDFLQQEGLAEDTIVIYTSDQGFFLGEHGFFDKRLMYEPSLTTPLIVRWPGHTRPGSVNDDMVLNIDHAPTLLDVLGAPIAKEMQGRSYKSILEGQTPAGWRTSMYYRYWMHLDSSHSVPAHYGVRTRDYSLIYFYGKGLKMTGAKDIDTPPEWELYDLKKDPAEMRNVYADPAYASTVRELRAELDRLRRDLGDDR
jgi:arylsulfatase A-like enzyme